MGNLKSDTCPTFISKDVNNYSEQIFNYDDYNLKIDKVGKNIACNNLIPTSKEDILCEDKIDLIIILRYRIKYLFLIFEYNEIGVMLWQK